MNNNNNSDYYPSDLQLRDETNSGGQFDPKTQLSFFRNQSSNKEEFQGDNSFGALNIYQLQSQDQINEASKRNSNQDVQPQREKEDRSLRPSKESSFCFGNSSQLSNCRDERMDMQESLNTEAASNASPIIKMEERKQSEKKNTYHKSQTSKPESMRKKIQEKNYRKSMAPQKWNGNALQSPQNEAKSDNNSSKLKGKYHQQNNGQSKNSQRVEASNELDDDQMQSNKKSESCKLGKSFSKSISMHSSEQKEEKEIFSNKYTIIDCLIFLLQCLSYFLVGVFQILNVEVSIKDQERAQFQQLQSFNVLMVSFNKTEMGMCFIISSLIQLILGVILTCQLTLSTNEQKQKVIWSRIYLALLSVNIIIQYEPLVMLQINMNQIHAAMIVNWLFVVIFFQIQQFGNIILKKCQNICFTALIFLYMIIRIQIVMFSISSLLIQIFLFAYLITKKIYQLDIQIVEQNLIGQQKELLTGVKDFYNNMLNLLPQGIVVVNSQKEMVYHNSSITKLLQCEPDKIIDQISNISTQQSDIRLTDSKKQLEKLSPDQKQEPRQRVLSFFSQNPNGNQASEFRQNLLASPSYFMRNSKNTLTSKQNPKIELTDLSSAQKSQVDLTKRITNDRTAKIQKSTINIQQHESEINGLDQNLKISQLLQKLFNIGSQDQNTLQQLRRVKTTISSSQMKKKSSIQQKQKQSNLSFSNDTIQVQLNFNNKSLLLNLILCEFQCYEASEEEISIEPVILMMIEDISQQIQMKELEVKNQCKMKMLASVSHELRTPLNCSMSMLEVLKTMIPEELTTDFIEPALNSQHLLLNIINDILDFAQIDVGKFKFTYQQFDMKNLIQNCIKLIELQAKMKSIQLYTEFSEEINYAFYSDPNRIRQIILNLLSNALKFTQKGYISIKVEKESDTLIKITVKDTGIGIASKDINKIFEVFGKIDLKNKKLLNTQGVGLGLSIASQLAKGLGQNKNIQVKSTLGKGSSFWFYLENIVHQSSQKILFSNLENGSEIFPAQEPSMSMNNSTNLPCLPQAGSQRSSFRLYLEPKAENSCSGYQAKQNSFTSEQSTQKGNQRVSIIISQNNVTQESSNNYLKSLSTNNQRGGRGSLSNNLNINGLQMEIFEKLQSKHNNECYNDSGMLPQDYSYSSGQLDGTEAYQMDDQSNVIAIEEEESHHHVDQNQILQIRLRNHFKESPVREINEQKHNKYHNQEQQYENKSSSRDEQSQKMNEKEQNFDTPKQISSLMVTSISDLPIIKCSIKQRIQTLAKKLVVCNCLPILIVDDNEFNRYVLQKLFLSFNLQVDQACNGQIGVDKVENRYKENSNKEGEINSSSNEQCMSLDFRLDGGSTQKCCSHYKIIFMDLDMPIKNGFEATRDIKQFYHFKKIPQLCPLIIACTAYVGEQEKQLCKESGMDYFLSKPISPVTFDNLILSVFERIIEQQ